MTTSRSSLKVREAKRRLGVAVAKLKEWAAECAECDGTGLMPVAVREIDDAYRCRSRSSLDMTQRCIGPKGHDGPHGFRAPCTQHCPECLDIREAIEDLEMPL